MTAEISKTNGQAIIVAEKLESFTERLHDQPLPKQIKVNKHANDSKYIPIAVVEKKLDELFFGLWQIKNFRWQVVTNEIIGSLELGVFHPVAKTWIWREGAGAVMIQQKKNSAIDDITAKIKNTLVKDFPHLKAACLTNAAKSLGPAFGRDLNRDYWEEYEGISAKIAEIESDEFKAKFEAVKTDKDLKQLWVKNPQWHNNEVALDYLMTKRKELNGSH